MKSKSNTEEAKGNACVAGDIHIVDNPEADGSDLEPEKIPFALLIEFDSADEVRKAMSDGSCTFTVFGG